MTESRLHLDMGLNDAEYGKIVETLGREPNVTELGMYAVMWSEHCGYKYSRPVLRLFSKYRQAMDTGAVENAGVVDIGGGLGIVMKMESHNHPSAVEPFQGAATGVGGILRDIFTMGARPIGILNSLRFGTLDDPRTRYLFEHVVGGIAHYGNCVGVPTIGGEIYFHPCYAGNPLVNAMAVGVVSLDAVASAAAVGVGNPVIYVGSATGRDGIHGATFASVELGPDSDSKRPNVQMGDPFMEKLLIEATLEALATGFIVGIQDMGAAGLTCSTCETAAKAGNGMTIDVRKVPLRESTMTPYEIMLSESQERMLAIAEKGKEAEVVAIFHKWGLNAEVVGEVTDTGRVVILDNGKVAADVPAASLTDDCPTYYLKTSEPAYLKQRQTLDISALAEPSDLTAVVKTLLGRPSIASKRWAYEQYDHMVQTQTIALPAKADAALLKIRGTNKALALTTDCNSRYVYLDPYVGAQHCVAESLRNLACTGARALAVTDCLNFANPEKPDNFWQFQRAVQGLADACEALGTPVISGNVSFYNETPNAAIYPTPTIGMLGLIEDADTSVGQGFLRADDCIYLLGGGPPSLGGSEFLAAVHGIEAGLPPALDLAREKSAQYFVLECITLFKIVHSAHDISEGGFAVAVAECCIASGLGARITMTDCDALHLFGERSASYVLTVAEANADQFEALAESVGLNEFLHRIGVVKDDGRLLITNGERAVVSASLADLSFLYESSIPAALGLESHSPLLSSH